MPELNTLGDSVTTAVEDWLSGGDKVFGIADGVKTAYPLGAPPALREFADVDSDLLASDYGRGLVLTHTSAQNLNVELEATIAYGAGFEVLIVALTDDATLTFQSGANINGQTSDLIWTVEAVATSNQGVYLKKRATANHWLLLGATPV